MRVRVHLVDPFQKLSKVACHDFYASIWIHAIKRNYRPGLRPTQIESEQLSSAIASKNK